MPNLLKDKFDLKPKTRTTMTSTVKKKLSALENILDYVKMNGNSEPKHLIKTKQKAVKLFSKMLKIIKNLENGKYENVSTICDKKLPELLMDLKSKSLFYHLEALFVENLRSSISKQTKSCSKKQLHRIKNNFNSCIDLSTENRKFSSTKLISLNKSECFQTEKQNLVVEINKYVKHFLVNIGFVKIQKQLADSIINEFEVIIEMKFFYKQESKHSDRKSSKNTLSKDFLGQINSENSKIHSSSNNNSSELIRIFSRNKLKNFTTFIYYNNNNNPSCKNDYKLSKYSSYVRNNDQNSERRNIYLKIKDFKEKHENIDFHSNSTNDLLINKENINDDNNNKTVDEISSAAMKFDLGSNCTIINTNLENDISLNENKLETLNNKTHSISDIHILEENRKLEQTNSNLCVSQVQLNDVAYDSTSNTANENHQDIKTFDYADLSNNIRCMRIINSAMQSAKLTRSRTDIILKFVLSPEEKLISVKHLENIVNYEIKSYIDGDNCKHCVVGINISDSINSKKELQHEYKIKRSRILRQIIMVPKIVYNYLYNNTSKKDHRIVHIEQFCNCQITLKTKFDSNDTLNFSSKSSILVNVIYDIEKGNELGCFNMIKRMLNISQYQVRIIREYRVTTEGNFEESFHK